MRKTAKYIKLRILWHIPLLSVVLLRLIYVHCKVVTLIKLSKTQRGTRSKNTSLNEPNGTGATLKRLHNIAFSGYISFHPNIFSTESGARTERLKRESGA